MILSKKYEFKPSLHAVALDCHVALICFQGNNDGYRTLENNNGHQVL